MKTQEKYEVVVGNIGSVHTGKVKANARAVYRSYVKLSKSGKGRASGEPVTMFMDGEPIAEHHAGEVTRKVRKKENTMNTHSDSMQKTSRVTLTEQQVRTIAWIRTIAWTVNADVTDGEPIAEHHADFAISKTQQYVKELIEANLPPGKTAEERPAAVAAVMAALVGNGTKEYARLCRLAAEEARQHNDLAPEDAMYDSAADGWEDAAETADPSPTASPSGEPCYGCNAPGPHKGKATVDLTGCDDLPDGDLPTSIKTFCNECLGKWWW